MNNIKLSTKLIPFYFILVSIFFSSYTANLSAFNFSPKIIFDEHDHDFGNVSSNQELIYKFRFKNEGSEKLIITNYMVENDSSKSVGALMFTNEKREYEPGESGEVVVICNTSELKGEYEMGFEIETNDPSNNIFRLHINFNITK